MLKMNWHALMLAMAALPFVVGAADWIKGSYVRPHEDDVAALCRECRNDVLKRTFRARDSSVAKAEWRVAAVGMRDLFVNGRRVTSTALPPLTIYRKRVLEEVFDVTPLVRPGAENELRIELGNGWWNLSPLKMWYSYELWKILPQGEPAVNATLDILYSDGRRESIETGNDWLSGKGRIVKNSIYLGVKEDASLASDGEWSVAQKASGPKGKIFPAGDFPKTVVYDRWNAKSVRQVMKGVWVVDFGVNFAGTFRAKLRGVPRGHLVTFRAGERLNDDKTVNVSTAVAGQIKNPDKGPLFDVAEQRNEWVSPGEGETVFEPRFTFHVFRYVQIAGLSAAPSANDFEALAWSADVKDCSSFTCSNEKLNRLHEICRRTFRANLQSVQSDCPGREKFGYGGDIAGSAESFRVNWSMAPFYRKVIRDFLDEAAEDGIFTETAPYVGIGSRPVLPKSETGGRSVSPMGWTLGVPVMADVLLRYDGDIDIVREAYPALVRFADIISARYPDDDIPECLGDWIAIEKADTKLSVLAHWHEFLSKTAKFARVLKKGDDAVRFSARAAKVAERFRRLYLKAGGVVNNGVQGEQLFALYNGLLPKSDVPFALAVLERDIVAHGRSLTTGFFGTQYLFEYLSANGKAALAGDVATHEGYPGYFHMMNCGATTLWEEWDEKQCLNVHSNCHPMFGSVEQWMIRYLLGICVTEDSVGCDRVRIVPHAVAGVTSASGWLDTPKGRISVSWKLEGGKMQVEKSVPAGIVVLD
ncbi:MAG: family 78 glycoside hydrolase catalytic domain [Kiritimatiellae bacterium]|nr:family 78 glycoside hydrolase catalytic domain [Kiritimatiellia bacterium]